MINRLGNALSKLHVSTLTMLKVTSKFLIVMIDAPAVLGGFKLKL